MQRILVVDDSTFQRRQLKRAIAALGFEVFEAADGELGLEQLRQQMVDLVISDLVMPNLDGFGFIAKLRAEFDPPPPVLVLSADIQAQTRAQVMELGARGFLNKPFNAAEFEKHVLSILEERAGEAN